MKYKHGRTRGVSKILQGPVQSTASFNLSPPEKTTKEGIKEEFTNKDFNTKNLEVKSLETKNVNLSQEVEKQHEQLTEQANIF